MTLEGILAVPLLCAALLAVNACGSNSGSGGGSTGTDDSIPAEDAPPDASTSAGFAMVLLYEFGINGLGNTTFDRSVIMTFADGSFTRDVGGVLLLGVEGSRAGYPEAWGAWRGDPASGDIEVSGDGGNFKAVSATRGTPLEADQRLEGCYKASGSISAAGTEVGSTTDTFTSNEYCFLADGQFSTESNSSTTSAQITTASSSGSTGYYRIEDDVISLEFDDSTVVRHVLGLYADDADPQLTISLDSTAFARPLL